MAADLTGLTPYVDYSKKLMEEAFPGGKAGVPEEALMSNFKTRIWGTGAAPGVASYFARRGFEESDPGFQYEFARQMKEAEQELANQYQARQIAALNTGRTAVLTEPTFRVSEAGASGYYEGAPTPQTAYVQAIERNAAEMRKREDIKNLAGGIGSLLNWLYPTGGRGGVGPGGLPGGGLNLMDLTGIPSLYSFLTGNKFPGLLPTGKSIFDSLFGGGGSVNTSVQPGATQWDWALDPVFNPGAEITNAAPQFVWDELSQSFVPSFSSALAPAAGAGAGAAAAGAGFLAPGGVGPAASSIEAGLIEMLGPELAAQLGFTTAPAGAAAGAGAVGATAPAWASALPFAAFALPAMMPLLVGDQSGAIEDAEARSAQADIYAHPEIAEEMISDPWRRPRAYRSAMENHRDANIRNRFMAALGGTSIDWPGSLPTGEEWGQRIIVPDLGLGMGNR